MKLQYGIRRLVLIQAGSHRFSDFPIDKPLSIYGRNNTGKSQTINGLQFLIFRTTQEMDFGDYDSNQSKAFYFKSEYSIILSEIMVKDGVFLYGAYGKGSMNRNDYEHFLIKTQFRREDFLENGKHLKAKEVFDKFERNGHRVHFLNRDQVKHALTGNYMAANIPHDITLIPIKEVTDARFSVFKNIYKNLLTMKKVNERDIKALLLEVFANVLANTSVDFFKVKSEAFRAHDNLQHEIKTLRKIEFHVDKLARQQSAKAQSLVDLKEIKTRIAQIYKIRLKQIPISIETARNSKSEMEDFLRDSSIIYGQYQTKASQASQAIGQWKAALAAIEAGHLKFSVFSQFGGTAEQIIQRLDTRINSLHEDRVALAGRIQRSAHKSPEAVRREIVGTKRMIDQNQSRYDALMADDSWLNEDSLGLDIRQKGLLTSVLSDYAVSIRGASILSKEEGDLSLSDIANDLGNGVLRLGNVSLSCQGLKVNTYQEDPADILAMLESAQISLASLEDELNVVLDIQASEDRLDRIRANIEKETREREEYLLYLERAKSEDSLREQLAERLAEQHHISTEQAAHAEKSAQVRRSLDQAITGIKKLEQEKINLAEACQETFYRDEEIGFIAEVFFDDSSEIDADLIEAYIRDGKSLYGKYVGSSNDIRHLLETIFMEYSKHAGEESEEEAIKKLIDEVDTLPEKATMLENFHLEAVVKMASALSILDKNYIRLENSVNDLNRKINGKKVSNLQSFKLKLLPNQQALDSIRTLLQSMDDNSAVKDMFSNATPSVIDHSLYRDALKFLSEMVTQIGSITVSDLFQVAFEIVDESGKCSLYTSLDGVASNGTTMTLKSLFSMHLIRYLYDSKVSTINLPFYVDEATNIDDKNRQALITMAQELGFVPVFASVDPIVTANYSIDLAEAKTEDGLLVTQEAWIRFNDKEEKKAEDQLELI